MERNTQRSNASKTINLQRYNQLNLYSFFFFTVANLRLSLKHSKSLSILSLLLVGTNSFKTKGEKWNVWLSVPHFLFKASLSITPSIHHLCSMIWHLGSSSAFPTRGEVKTVSVFFRSPWGIFNTHHVWQPGTCFVSGCTQLLSIIMQWPVQEFNTRQTETWARTVRTSYPTGGFVLTLYKDMMVKETVQHLWRWAAGKYNHGKGTGA